MTTEHDKLVEDCARAISKHRTGLEAYWHGDIGAARAAIAIAVERCAAVAEQKMGGYLCPFGRDKPGDPTWDLTDKDKCPVCGFDGEGALSGCHDTAQGRIAAAIRALLSPNDRGQA